MDTAVKVKYLDVKPAGRVLVTSDIHGHAEHLRSVLDKADFGGDDLLIIVGDLLEKGPDSLGTLRYVMNLVAQGRALTVWGNVDYWRVCMFDALKADPAVASDFLAYLQQMRRWKGTSFYDEMCRELGAVPETVDDLLAVVPAVEARFKAELDFLRAQPTIIETPCYRFVHGGLRYTEFEKDLTCHPQDLMKFDDFLTTARREGMCFDKYTVVGHWPVALNCTAYADLNPIIDPDTHIIAIDGGCGIKHEGQLDLLILPSLDCPAEAISHVYHDDLPTVTATRDQEASSNSFLIRWGDAAVRFLCLDRDMAEVEHIRTGRRMWVPADFLYDCPSPADLRPGDTATCSDCSDFCLPVKAGDTISVIKKTTRGIIAKKDGIVGWIYDL